MRRQSLIARKLPAAIGHEVNGQEHLDESLAAGQEVVGLVEDAMTQTGSKQDAQKAVDKQRVEQLVLDLLLLV